MKTLSALLFFIPFFCISQTEEDNVKQIREWYTEIENSLDNCIKVPLTFFYDEDYVVGGSNELEAFYDTTKNEYVKIVEHTYYDWAEDATEYYLNNGKIFFVFSHGNSPGQMYTAEELNITEEEFWEMGGEAKTLNYYEDRYYVRDDSCFKYLHKELELDASESPDMSTVKNEQLKTEDEDIPDMIAHGYKMLAHFKKQLKNK